MDSVTLDVTGGGEIGYSPRASSYAAGTLVSLHANRDSGWVFSHWIGDASGTEDDITIRMDGDRSVTANFVVDTGKGNIRVDILPAQAAAEGAAWKYDNYTSWRPSGDTLNGLSLRTGKYVSFKDIPGWIAPEQIRADIVGGQTTVVSGAVATYREIKGSVQVNISPPQAAQSGARWRINGGVWLDSGTTLPDAPTGSNSIDFLALGSWTSPAPQIITIQRGLTTVYNAEYGPPAGLPIITSVTPRTGPIAGGTTVTLDGANFQADASVSFGGLPATSVTVVSPVRIEAVSPARTSYGTIALSLTSGGQTEIHANGFSYLHPQGSNIEVAGQIGGNVEAVAVAGNLCYYGEGSTLVVMDFTNSTAPVERGRITLPNFIKDIAISGSTCYVACANSGLYAVDISVPIAPRIVGFYQTEGGAYGVKIDDNKAYVGSGNSGLAILDVANPAGMFHLGSLDTPGTVFRLDVGTIGSDRYAFLADDSLAVHIVQVTDSANPIEIARISPGFRDVKVVGTKLYASGSGRIRIFNISNPATPGEVGIAFNVGSSFLDVVGTRLYACDGSLRVKDLTTTPEAVELGSLNLGGSCYRLIVSNGLAFAAMSSAGLRVASINNPVSMSLRSSVQSGITAVQGVSVLGGIAYVGTDDGLHTIDVSNPALPVRIGHLAGARVTDLAVANDKATLVDYYETWVRVANVANPSALSLLGTYTGIEAVNVALLGNTPVLTGATTGSPRLPKIDILDITQPSSPHSSGSLALDSSTGGAADSVAVVGSWAFVGRTSTNTLYVVSLSNPSLPQKVGSVGITQDIRPDVAASEDGNFVYVPCGSGVQVVDVTVKSAPVLVQVVSSPASPSPSASKVHVAGTRLYADWGGFVSVFDISVPASPQFVAYYDTPGAGLGLYVVGDLIYVADYHAGLTILRLKDVDKPTIVITAPTSNPVYSTTNAFLTLGGTATDLQGVVRVTWENDRGGGGVAQGTTSWSVANIQLAAGVNVLTVTAEDAQGNLARDSIAVTTTLPETVGPALLITGPQLPPAFIFTAAMLQLTGTAADVSGVQTVDWANDRGGSGTATGTTAWSASIPLLYGPNHITLTARDTVGNESQSELLVTYLPPDTTAPSITITFPTPATEFLTAQPILNVSGEASDDRGLKQIAWSNDRGGSGAATGSGIWAVNGISLQPGLNSITLTAEDEAGNTSQDNVAVTYTPYDADADGIPDDWEMQYFSGLGTVGAGTDMGSTGVSDLLKFAFGMNPVHPDMGALPRVEMATDVFPSYPMFKFRRLIAPGNLIYRVGVSETLGAWDWSGERVEQIGVPTPTGDGITEEVTVRFKPGLGDTPSMTFFRLQVLIPPADIDVDGIDDVWENTHFSGLSDADQFSDFGITGIPDLLKFAFGMDPRNPDRNLLPRSSVVAEEGKHYARFQYNRLISPGLLVYQVGVSSDLETWDWSGTKIESVGSPVETGDGVTEVMTVRLKAAIEDLPGPTFLRLRVLGGG